MGLTTLIARINAAYEQGRYQAAEDMAWLMMNSGFVPLPSKDPGVNQRFVDGTIKAVADQHAKIKDLTAGYGFFERWAYKRGYISDK